MWFAGDLLGPTDPTLWARVWGFGVQGFRKHSLLWIWVVVKIMVPFWVPFVIRHLIFRVPKKGL